MIVSVRKQVPPGACQFAADRFPPFYTPNGASICSGTSRFICSYGGIGLRVESSNRPTCRVFTTVKTLILVAVLYARTATRSGPWPSLLPWSATAFCLGHRHRGASEAVSYTHLRAHET